MQKKNLHYFSNLALLISLLVASIGCSDDSKKLKEGVYRGVFSLQDENQIPFNFTLEQQDEGNYELTLINGEGRFSILGNESVGGELVFDIDLLDNQFVVTTVETGGLKGYLQRSSGEGDKVPFEANYGDTHRFSTSSNTQAAADATGTWEVLLSRDGSTLNHGVGVFTQTGNQVEGTIMTNTGDMRHLQGDIVGDSLYLSAFAGSFPLLIKARLSTQDQFEGKIIRASGETDIKGLFNPEAELDDPYSLTLSNLQSNPLSLEFPDLEGNAVSLEDPEFQGKVIVLNIMGSWCPNCMDEAGFLSPWYQKNKDRGVEIVALSFERQDDLSYAKRRLDAFKKRFDVRYAVLFGGKTDKDEISQKLPFIDGVHAFPTTIFLDKDRRIKKIHTGFSGPATGVHYEDYIKDFNETIDALLAEG